MTSETAAAQGPRQGVLTGSRVAHVLVALVVLVSFCIQLVLVVAILLALRPPRDGRIWRIARLDALLGIVIT